MNELASELPAAGRSAELFVTGPAGRLETLVAMPKAAPRGLCVVCHPHPLFGGAMTNKVVYTLAASALKADYATARFNFRGVGKSTGLYDEARGETDDALAVEAWLRAQLALVSGQDAATLPLVLAGFSFGAYVALKAAARRRPQKLVSIAIPFGRYVDASEPPPHPQCPWLAVHSHDDDVVAFDATASALRAYQPPPKLVEFDGAGHFFNGRLTELQDIVLPFMQATP